MPSLSRALIVATGAAEASTMGCMIVTVALHTNPSIRCFFHFFMILTMPHAVRTEQAIEAAAPIWPGPCPGLHNTKHTTVDFTILIPNRWMVEDAHNIVQDLIHGYTGVFPAIDHPRSHILQYRRRYLTRWLIKNVGEVVFRQQLMQA